jgi:DNA-binding NarL/FixJ family response regulator
MDAQSFSQSQTRRQRVLLVDDHPVMREGFAQLLNYEPDLQVCGHAESAAAAMAQVGQQHPDLVIVDISLGGTSGIELIKQLRAQQPDLLVVVLSMHDESVYAERALRAGAKGYVMKQEESEAVIRAIRRVLRGELYVSERLRSKMLHKFVNGGGIISGVERLSDRELEVFELLGKGRGTRDIANDLHLSIKTVETYRAHIKEKLKLRGASELVHLAVQWVNNQQF